MTLVILAVALVFDSVWATSIIFLSLPIALGGVVFAFWVMKAAFTREAAVGVILVIGLAVNQSILMVDSGWRAAASAWPPADRSPSARRSRCARRSTGPGWLSW